MIPRHVLASTSLAIQAIEETIAATDHFNIDFPDHDTPSCSLCDCEFPSEVLDPLALVRILRGDDFARQLEYQDDLEHTLHVLTDCLGEGLIRRGKRESELFHEWSDDEDPSSTTDS